MTISKLQGEMHIKARVVAVDTEATNIVANNTLIIDEMYLDGVEVDMRNVNGTLLTNATAAAKALFVAENGIPATSASTPPRTVAATGGSTIATVTFTAPYNNGGTAITGYTVVSTPPGGVDTNAGTTGLSHAITGLTNGVAYTFKVTATNAAGTSEASAASNAVTPA